MIYHIPVMESMNHSTFARIGLHHFYIHFLFQVKMGLSNIVTLRDILTTCTNIGRCYDVQADLLKIRTRYSLS